jgi:hypothetical protein
VTILAGNWPFWRILAGGLWLQLVEMLLDVAKCELALDDPTGLGTKRSYVRVMPGASNLNDYGRYTSAIILSFHLNASLGTL